MPAERDEVVERTVEVVVGFGGRRVVDGWNDAMVHYLLMMACDAIDESTSSGHDRWQ